MRKNLWGRFPWHALWCVMAEKMGELDLYFAEDARIVIERIDNDRVGLGGCLGPKKIMQIELCGIQDEAHVSWEHWFLLDVDQEKQTIYIKYLADENPSRVEQVATMATRWFEGTRYGIEDAVLRPMNPKNSGRLLAEALMNDTERQQAAELFAKATEGITRH